MQRVCVVVGASRGIGLATAQALARPGAHLVLGARDLAALEEQAVALRSAGASVTALACDVRQPADLDRLIVQAAELTGQIDLLVNSAGSAVVAPVEALAVEDWEQTIQVSLTGTFLSCRRAVAYMRAGGLIVNIASVAARQPFPGWSAYAAAKAGLVAFSSVLREELRPRGLRVTVVLPAATDTALWDSIPGEWNRANMLQSADVGALIAGLLDQPLVMTTEELVVGHVAGRL